MERGELLGVKVEDLVDHYLGSRASSTLGTYAAAYRRVVEHMVVVVALVFECMGKVSPTKSALVLQVKKTCLKRCLEKKVAAAAAKPMVA